MMVTMFATVRKRLFQAMHAWGRESADESWRVAAGIPD